MLYSYLMYWLSVMLSAQFSVSCVPNKYVDERMIYLFPSYDLLLCFRMIKYYSFTYNLLIITIFSLGLILKS